MIIAGKHISEITINLVEFVLDDNVDPMELVNIDAAKAFLKEKGLSDDDFELLVN